MVLTGGPDVVVEDAGVAGVPGLCGGGYHRSHVLRLVCGCAASGRSVPARAGRWWGVVAGAKVVGRRLVAWRVAVW